MPRLAALAPILLSLLACGGPLSEAESQFDQGQYPRAKQSLTSLEHASRGWRLAQRAEYALYMGLTFLALGDLARARSWLEAAHAIEETLPGSLSPDHQRRLREGLTACAGP